MREMIGWRQRRDKRTVFRDTNIESCTKSCCEPKSQKERFIGGVESKPVGQRTRLDFQVADVAKPLLAVKRIVEKGEPCCVWPGERGQFHNKQRHQRQIDVVSKW
eukprot:12427025-Karenia_brevis.AAC.1